MFLAINQNGYSSKKRKKELEQMAKQQLQQQQLENQQLQQEYLQQNRDLSKTKCEKSLGLPTCQTETISEPTTTTTTTTPSASTTTTNTTATNFVDKMLMKSNVAVEKAPGTTKCKNCQHELQYVLQQQQHQQRKQQHLPKETATDFPHNDFTTNRNDCRCSCSCIYKAFNSSNNNNFISNNIKQQSHKTSSCQHLLESPTPPTLHAVYLCLGTLTLALTTLAILFYSHVSSTSSAASTTATFTQSQSQHPTAAEVVPFREQFRRELYASDDVLRSIVAKILQQQLGLRSAATATATSGSSSSSSRPNINSFNYEPLENFRYRSTTLPYDDSEIVKNERKFIRSSHSSYSNDNVVDTSSGSGSSTHSSSSDDNEVQHRIKRRDISSPSSMHADPLIEFFNPNHRKVLEEQDLEIRKRTGLKGAAPGGDEWIYLNTYCRVPEKIITGFCKGTQEYCPPSPPGPQGPQGPKGLTGPPGLPGIPGPKGNRGDVGLPGPPGVDGAPGAVGPRGPKGDIGIPGRMGLDGRDGVPGEPGLDGVPGRAGADGIPGKDGMPGRDGRDGMNGKDGKDGAPGPKGMPGPPGERGLKGISGPRGRVGKSGTNGTPGIPGINAWKVQLLNGSFSNDLLVPPSIADINAPHIQRVVIVEEGKTLNLSCAATGFPRPHIEWRRDDGRTINVNGVEMSSVSGPFLKFTNITRLQMAAYTCFADNGIAPVANATFLVEVHFSPMISVYRQMIYAEYGHSASLECLVEAFPDAIRYWERAYDGKILDPGEKYRIESYPEGFKTTMRLTISNLRKDDFGYYHCVARNELNATMVNFEIAPQDPNSEMPYVGKEIKVYGQRPPESECPICEQCPDPSLYQCKDSINSNFDIQPTGNYSYPGLPKRQKSCLLYAVGKPVFHKAVKEIYGCWLKDAAAKESDREKTFVTNENDAYNLFEFPTKMQFRMNSVPKQKYEIREGFHGNAHVVYNGSFYYHQRNSDLVVKLDLTTLKKITTQLPYSGKANGNKLYSTDYNYMDFNVDEVGLWVIYSTYDSNNTLVAKLDAENLKMQYNFNITLDHRKFGEMFIVCGHLYAIDSCVNKNSQIRYVVDLYNGKLLNVDLPFSNPFSRTTTVGYNPQTVELYSWDKGNALTYPIRYHEQSLGVADQT